MYLGGVVLGLSGGLIGLALGLLLVAHQPGGVLPHISGQLLGLAADLHPNKRDSRLQYGIYLEINTFM